MDAELSHQNDCVASRAVFGDSRAYQRVRDTALYNFLQHGAYDLIW